MVRRTRLERVNERVTTEGGVRRGLGEKLIAFCEIGLVGYNILRRGLIETQRLFCFYGTQLLLQFSNLCLLPMNFFGCLGLVGDSPEGPLKQPGESCLKPAKNHNKTPLT
jgi:hypothetical protein